VTKNKKTLLLISDVHIDFYIGNRFDFIIRGKNWEKRLCNEFEAQMAQYLVPADYIVVAGDISNNMLMSVRFLQWLASKYKMVYWTHGNHDYVVDNITMPHVRISNYEYIQAIDKLIHMVDKDSKIFTNKKNIVWLNKDTPAKKIPGTRHTIAGSMGVADFTYGLLLAPKKYNKSWYVKHWPSWYDGLGWRMDVQKYLKFIIEEKANMMNLIVGQMPTIMVTHFMPSHATVARKFQSDWRSGYFTFDGHKHLKEFNKNGGEYWLFGHTHERVDIKHNNIRLMSNPKGYPDEIYHHEERSRKCLLELD
jgi:metallophosphoesterase superfamily enzyme